MRVPEQEAREDVTLTYPDERNEAEDELGPLERYRVYLVDRWLAHVSEAVRRMATLREQYDAERETYDMLSAVRYGEKVSVSAPAHGDDRVAAHVERIASLVDGMAQEYASYVETSVEARTVFAGVTVPYGQAVLSRRFLGLEQWDGIADAVGYSVRQVHRIADAAKLECYDLMPHVWRDPYHPAL